MPEMVTLRDVAYELTRACFDLNVPAIVGAEPPNLTFQVVSTPTGFIFPVTLDAQTRLSSFTGIFEDIALRLTSLHPSARCELIRHPLAIEVKKSPAEIVILNPEYIRKMKIRPGTGVVGVSFRSNRSFIVGLNPGDPETSHFLFAGKTGSGKSTALQSFILSLAYSTPPSDLSIVLIDPKRRSLPPLGSLPHTILEAYDEESMTSAVLWLEGEVRRRINSGASSPRILAIIEEASDLIYQSPGIQPSLVSSAKLGREMGVSIIIVDQKPLASNLGSDLLQQLGGKIVGKLRTPREASDILGLPDPTLSRLSGKGSMVYFYGGSDGSKMQTFLPDIDGLMKIILETWQRANPRINIEETVVRRLDTPAVSSRFDVESDAEAILPVALEYAEGGKVRRGGFTRMATALDSEYGGSTITRIQNALAFLRERGDIT